MPQARPCPRRRRDGYLLVLAIMLPVAGILLALAAWRPPCRAHCPVLLPAGLSSRRRLRCRLAGGHALAYFVGGWAPPLGIALRADGLSAAMLMTTAIVICATGLFAPRRVRQPRGCRSAWAAGLLDPAAGDLGALNAVALGSDLFNLYVALELLTFAAVPLVCLKGSPETIRAALRYMLFALLGSVLYLLGTVLIFGAYGTLDIVLLSARVRPEPSPGSRSL